MEIKQSIIPKAGLGVFSTEDIKSGMYFIPITETMTDGDDLGKKINDLAFNETIDDYVQQLEEKTNIIYVTTIPNFFSQPEIICYYAIKDIKMGDELSRVYGIDYWINYCFWEKHQYPNWPETGLDLDLPADWSR